MRRSTMVTFDADGGIEIDHTGFKGKACELTTKEILKGLDTTVIEDRKKPEYAMSGIGTGNVIGKSRL